MDTGRIVLVVVRPIIVLVLVLGSFFGQPRRERLLLEDDDEYDEYEFVVIPTIVLVLVLVLVLGSLPGTRITNIRFSSTSTKVSD